MHPIPPGMFSFGMDRSIPVVQATAIGQQFPADAAGPTPLAASSILSVSEHLLSDRDLDQLVKEGYSTGLIRCMAELQDNTAKQIWLVDDSGSMITYDGTVRHESSTRIDDYSFVKCSRWEELRECVKAHIKLSGTLRFPTTFRFLNHWNNFAVCETPESDARRDVERGLEIMSNNTPEGPTPLRQNIMEIHAEVESMMPYLQATGQRVSLVICTDGLPSDASNDDFVRELRGFEGLPVWIVIRLCTDELEAVEFWNRLDSELEIPVDVIDDFLGEGIEVASYNPWLNYSLPLHHVREMGVRERVLDLLDERPLSPHQQKEVCTIIFGEEKMAECPDPAVDWLAFLGYMDAVLAGEQLQWDPIRQKMKPWVNFRKTKSKQRKVRKLRKGSPPGCFGR